MWLNYHFFRGKTELNFKIPARDLRDVGGGGSQKKLNISVPKKKTTLFFWGARLLSPKKTQYFCPKKKPNISVPENWPAFQHLDSRTPRGASMILQGIDE